jgi:glutamate/aspartate transport system substrate-binding protein
MSGLPRKIAAVAAALIAGIQAAEADDLGPSLQKIKASGAISIGYRDSAIPMSYTDAQQQPVGFALDLCAIVANKVQLALGLTEMKINYKPVVSANGASLIEDGTIDLDCGAVAVKPDEKRAAFSIPVFESELKWIVPRRLRVEREGRRRSRWETISPSSADDLKGATVVLTQGSAATLLVLTLSSDRSLGLSILMSKDNAEAFRLVESGKASAFLADGVLLAGLKAGAKNPDAFGFLDDAYPGQPYALMLRKDDNPFKTLVDSALTEAMSSGRYANIYAKWFESPIPPKNVNLAIPMPRKLKELVTMPVENAAMQ